MAARKKPRQCPRCGHQNPPDERKCVMCMTGLIRAPWRMNKQRIKKVKAIAHSKGLDRDCYLARLSSVGVTSCKQLKRASYHRLIKGMQALPNALKRAA